MTQRLLILITLLLATCIGAYFYRERHRPVAVAAERASTYRPIQEHDDFDEPYVSDPEFVKESVNRKIAFPFKPGDRVAWIGSSSTYIGMWCRTMEFLLRSRHPDLNLTFSRHSAGGGTFELAAERLPDWLERSRPTLVFFNYGANDAAYGKIALNDFHQSMRLCMELTQKFGARAIQMTYQSGDIRQTGSPSYFRRKHYADDMLAFSKKNGWEIVDVFYPLDAMQAQGQALDTNYSINCDIVHLTDSAYVAWGFFLYDGINAPPAESRLEIDARDGRIVSTTNCKARVLSTGALLAFEREDSVLPILPPFPLPENNPFRSRIAVSQQFGESDYALKNGQKLPLRQCVPLEKHSKYLLKITGLAPGEYALECNGKPAGKATEKDFASGVNLNTLYLDAGVPAPWSGLAEKLWDGPLTALDARTLVFQIKRLSP